MKLELRFAFQDKEQFRNFWKKYKKITPSVILSVSGWTIFFKN